MECKTCLGPQIIYRLAPPKLHPIQGLLIHFTDFTDPWHFQDFYRNIPKLLTDGLKILAKWRTSRIPRIYLNPQEWLASIIPAKRELISSYERTYFNHYQLVLFPGIWEPPRITNNPHYSVSAHQFVFFVFFKCRTDGYWKSGWTHRQTDGEEAYTPPKDSLVGN